MNLHRIRLLAALTLTASTIGCAGSAGNTTREKALLPALRSAWVVVEEDFDRGVADGIEDGAIDEGVAALLHADAQVLDDGIHGTVETAKAASPKWPFLAPWAHRGVEDRVDDGEIVPGVADSGHERIENFSESLLKLEG